MPIGKISAFLLMTLIIQGVHASGTGTNPPYLERWGIYELDFTSPIQITTLRINSAGDTFTFSMRIDGDEYAHEEICTLDVNEGELTRLTENSYMDVYPSWSPDDAEIVYLSWPEDTLDIYVMDADGMNQRLLYDSGYHDADIHWVGEKIAFTRDSQIWIMGEDGTGATRLTDPPRAGEWGEAVLPFGDYDPRLSPDGERIVFERMVDDVSSHGNYDLFIIDSDGSNEKRLTDNGWTQGLAAWSPSGDSIVYSVSAVGTEGRYDIYMINSDGSQIRDLTSQLFSQGFLAHGPRFSVDGSKIFFIGEWWDWRVLATEVTCSLSSSEVVSGEDFIVSGRIEPAVPEAAATLTIVKPDGSTTEKTVVLDSEGAYSEVLEPSESGRWAVKVSWEGDLGHNASESQSVYLLVEEPQDGGSGIPGFPTQSIALGLIMGLLLYSIARIHGKNSVIGMPSPG
jgi:TolB protein